MRGLSLNGAWNKVAWAKSHLDELQAEVVASHYGDTIGFGQKFDPDTSTIEITLQGIPAIPVEWSLAAADILQNLRAALNYLAWELSRWNLHLQGMTRDPVYTTQFPIETRPWCFDEGRRYVPDVHPDHVTEIRAMQPNEAGHLSGMSEEMLRFLTVEELASRHALGILAELTNADKHRILPATVVSAKLARVGSCDPIDCAITDTNVFIQGEAIENGTKWAELKVSPAGPEPRVKVNDEIVSEIRFGGYGLLTVMPEVWNYVGSAIQHFDRLP